MNLKHINLANITKYLLLQRQLWRYVKMLTADKIDGVLAD